MKKESSIEGYVYATILIVTLVVVNIEMGWIVL